MKNHVKLFEQFTAGAGNSIDGLWCTYFWENFVFNPVALFSTEEEAERLYKEMGEDRYGDEIYMKVEEWFLENLDYYRKKFGVRSLDQLEKKAPMEMKRLMDEAFDDVLDDVGFDTQFGYSQVSELDETERDAVIDALKSGELEMPKE